MYYSTQHYLQLKNSPHNQAAHQKPQRYFLLTHSQAHIWLTFLYSPGNDATHSELGSHSSMDNQDNLLQTCPPASLI